MSAQNPTSRAARNEQLSLGRPLLIVAYDAGGAELIAAWARRHFVEEYCYVAEGPARRVFASAPALMLDRTDALARLAEFRTVLTGSSWGSDLEKIFVERAAALGIRSVTYLDHWTDYRERFTSAGRLRLPSEIWVADEHAEGIARAEFPGHPVRIAGNCYLEEIAAQVKARSDPANDRTARKRVLFVSEPLADAAARKYGDPNHFGYTELEALGTFLQHARRHWAREIEAIRIRRHPSEPRGKFDSFVDAAGPLPVSECGEAPLADDCGWADWIVGCQSMAMVVGLLAGKQVYSAIPADGQPCAIPYPGIVPLFQPRAARREHIRGTKS
jgi:hypothetical protein